MQLNKDQAKPTITFINACPAIMFANNRIAKLIGLKTNETNSIGTNNKAKKKEVPAGRNKEKKFTPCKWIQYRFMPIKILKLKANVQIIWLVIVKL